MLAKNAAFMHYFIPPYQSVHQLHQNYMTINVLIRLCTNCYMDYFYDPEHFVIWNFHQILVGKLNHFLRTLYFRKMHHDLVQPQQPMVKHQFVEA